VSVQQVLRKLGQWSLKLEENAPPGIISALDWLGHVAIIPGRVNPTEMGDQCWAMARYVGVLRAVESGEQYTLSGSGMAYWLGDENGVGDVIESPGVTISAETFANSVRALLPAGGAVTEGTLTNVTGTYDGVHTWQTRRSALDYVCDYYGADWRVNGDATLDAGPASALFRTTPECIIARRDASGYDMGMKALPGSLESTRDVSTYSTRVVVVADGYHIGDATASVVPYKDPHGNPVIITRVVDEQDDTLAVNADVRAQMILDKYAGPRRQVRLSVDDFDVAGDIEPGDTVWVWDPDSGLVDVAYEVPFRGRLLNPVPVRVLSLTWPITDGYSVGFRDKDGGWVDLTPWVEWESAGGGEVEIADSQSVPLTSGIGSTGTQVPGGGGGAGDASIPDTPVFGAFTSSSYQPDDGLSRAAVKVTWTRPLNTDGSTIVDGDHYEVRYRPTGTTDWEVAYAGWDQTSLTVANLPPSTGMDWQIRAVDYAAPINYGEWSATTAYSTPSDTTAPDVPAPPTVAASLIAVQVTHTLGAATGGTYNLALDLDHLEVHVGTSAGFTPDAASLVGKLAANGGMITGGIPAVGSYPVDALVAAGQVAYVRVVAVDRTGNRSTASSAVSATAELIDAAWITSLTASQITSGTVTASLILSGSIKTGTTGARVEQDSSGIRLYNSSGVVVVDLNASTGAASFSGNLSAATGTFAGALSAATGTFSGDLSGATVTGGTIQTAASGQRITMDATSGGTIWFRDAGSDYGFINGPGSALGFNSGNGGGSYRSRVFLTPGSGLFQNVNSSQVQVGGGVQVSSSALDLNTTSGTAYLRSPSGAVSVSAGGNISSMASGTNEVWGGGSVLLQSTGANASMYAAGNCNIQSSGGTYINGGGTATVAASTVNLGNGSSSQAIVSMAIYDNTSTFAANVGISTSPGGRFYRLTSSRRYKVGIAKTRVLMADIRALDPVVYYDRGQAEAAGGSTEGLSQQLGLIAEEVHQTTLGHLLTELDADGRPESVNYARVGVALIRPVISLADRLDQVEAAVASLRATIGDTQ
jgi:hypothetical protein